jgi:uncharacterized protein
MQNNKQINTGTHLPIIRTSYFRFYKELNDFLPAEQIKKIFPFKFRGTTSVKNAIQNIGVPHTEVDLIMVDGVSVDFQSQDSRG